MPRPAVDAQVRLALHPDQSSTVTATLTGPDPYLARATVLSAHGFRWTSDETMILARIDHDEPHYADQAARVLREIGATVKIDPALQEEIDTEWTYGNAPTHWQWLTRDEIREATAEAQRIHDHIAAGRLVIHLHAHDGWTTVAVGTYQDGKSVHLHGENYLRQETADYATEAEAVADFHRQYTVAVRPGPAPLTDIEHAAAEALTALPTEAPAPPQSAAPAEASPATVPVYAAGPGDHEALLNDFLTANGEWEKYRPHDETTIASHESLSLRIEFLHEAVHGDNAWTVAAYESPVGERLWHATATPTTPVEIMRALLNSLASEHAWGSGTPLPVTEEHFAEASRPLEDIGGWSLTVGARLIDWTAPTANGAGLRFDTFVKQGSVLPAWTIWGGNTADRPTWAIHLSTHAPTSLIQDITFELAYGQSHRQPQLHTASTAPRLPTQPAVTRPPVSTPRPAARR